MRNFVSIRSSVIRVVYIFICIAIFVVVSDSNDLALIIGLFNC